MYETRTVLSRAVLTRSTWTDRQHTHTHSRTISVSHCVSLCEHRLELWKLTTSDTLRGAHLLLRLLSTTKLNPLWMSNTLLMARGRSQGDEMPPKDKLQPERLQYASSLRYGTAGRLTPGRLHFTFGISILVFQQ